MKALKPVMILLLCLLLACTASLACAEISNAVYGEECIELEASTAKRVVPLHYGSNLGDVECTLIGGKGDGLAISGTDLMIPANWSGVALFTVADSEEIKQVKLYVYPAAPEIKEMTVYNYTITVSWQSVTDVTGYRLEWDDEDDTTETQYAILDCDTTSYTITNLTAGNWAVKLCAYTDSDDGYRASSRAQEPAPVQVGKNVNNILNAEDRELAYGTTTAELNARTEDGAEILYTLKSQTTPKAYTQKVKLQDSTVLIPAGYYGTITMEATALATTNYKETSKEFCIFVKPAAPSLSLNLKEGTTALASWSSVNGASSYYLCWGTKQNLSDAEKIQVYDTTHELVGLKPGLVYYVQVVAQVPMGSKGEAFQVASQRISIATPNEKSENTLVKFEDTTVGWALYTKYVSFSAYTEDEADITYTSTDCPVEQEAGESSFEIPAGYTGSFTVSATATETALHRETTVTITVTVGEQKLTSFKVVKAGKSVSLEGKTIQIKKGEKQRVKATSFKPSDATDKTVSYRSSNKEIASVNEKGWITAKKSGIVTITVKAKDGSGVKVQFRVKVVK